MRVNGILSFLSFCDEKRYLDFLWVILIYIGIFLRGSKLCGKRGT